MLTTFDEEALRKHGTTRDEISEVFESDLSFAEDLEPSIKGNNRAMVIGWTYSGRILEIGIEYFENEDREHIFHAMDAGKQSIESFERRIGHVRKSK